MLRVFPVILLAVGWMMTQNSATLAASGKLDTLPCPNAQTRLVVLGDSLADGLWGSLHRSFARCTSMQIVRLTQVSDGLAKSDAETWLDRYSSEIHDSPSGNTSDIVIVQIGANDITFIRQGSKRAAFGTPAWQTGYKDRARVLAKGLSGQAKAVIWFGLPIVGTDRLEPSYRQISALLQSGLSDSPARFVDIHSLTKFGGEDFTMNAEIEGRLVQLRAPDQVHFTSLGYDQVLSSIADELGQILVAKDRAKTLSDVVLQ